MFEFVYENLEKLSEIFPPKIYEKLTKYKEENNKDEFREILDITFESNPNLFNKIKEFEYLEKRKVLTKDKAKELCLKYLEIEDNLLNEFLELVPNYYEIIEFLAQNIKNENELKELIQTIKGEIVYKEKIADLLNEISLIYKDLGEFEKSLEFAKKTNEIFENILDKNHPDLAITYNNISMIYKDLGEFEKSLEFAKKSLEIREKILDKNHPNLATTYNNISLIYKDLGEFKKSLEFAKKLLEIIEKILDKNHPNLATTYNNISMIYKDLGEFEKSLEFAKKSLEIREKILDKNHPNLAQSYNNISIIYKDLGEFEKSLEFAKKSLEIREKILDKNHPNLATTYNNISLIYKDLEEFKKSLEFAKKALEIFEKVLDKNHPNLATTYNNISLIYKDLGEFEKSLEFAKKTNEIFEKVLDKNHPNLAQSYNNISLIYKDLEEFEKSLEFAKKALEIFEKVLDKNHPNLAQSYNNIAFLHSGFKQLFYFQKAKKIYLFNKTENNLRKDVEKINIDINRFKDEIDTKIKKIEIKNFKLLQNFEIELSNNINIIIGQNSSGKSSLLQAIALASMPKKSEDEPKEISKYFTKDKSEIFIKLTFANSTQKELKLFSDENRNNELNINFNFLILGYGSNIFGKYEILQSNIIGEKIVFAKGERRYFTKSLFDESFRGFNDILVILYELDKFEDEEAKIIKEIFRNTINDFLEKFKIVKKKNSYYFRDLNNRLLKLEDLSEGYKNLTLLLSDILIRLFLHRNEKIKTKDTLLNAIGVILIDEFDRHLHPTWQSKLVTKLKETFPNIQFILTTHNPMSILDREPEEIINLEITKDGIKAIKKDIGTKTIDVGTVLLVYFGVESVVGESMKKDLDRFYELKIDDKIDTKEFKELEKKLQNTIANSYINDYGYYKFLKFLKEKNIDIKEDMDDEKLKELMEEFKDML